MAKNKIIIRNLNPDSEVPRTIDTTASRSFISEHTLLEHEKKQHAIGFGKYLSKEFMDGYLHNFDTIDELYEKWVKKK